MYTQTIICPIDQYMRGVVMRQWQLNTVFDGIWYRVFSPVNAVVMNLVASEERRNAKSTPQSIVYLMETYQEW